MFKIKPEQVQRQLSSNLYFTSLQVLVEKQKLIFKRNNKGKIDLHCTLSRLVSWEDNWVHYWRPTFSNIPYMESVSLSEIKKMVATTRRRRYPKMQKKTSSIFCFTFSTTTTKEHYLWGKAIIPRRKSNIVMILSSNVCWSVRSWFGTKNLLLCEMDLLKQWLHYVVRVQQHLHKFL